MNADKIKSIISKKAKGDSTISAQLYQRVGTNTTSS